jgi:CheY-like chemotaxis protein
MPAILVVEPDPTTRSLLAEQLSALFRGARVLSTESADAGVELAQRASPGLVLVDLGLAEPGPLRFLARLRQEAAGARVPVVGLVGEPADEELLLTAEAAGFAAFLRKPVELRHLPTLLGPVLARPAT